MSSVSADLLPGRYRLEERVATGGYGEVWRGTDVALNRAIAVKLLLAAHARHPETLHRFREEAKHAGSVAHQNIARVYDYGEPDPPDPPYLVMEFVDGQSLAAILSGGPVDAARAMDVVSQAAAGLHAAHQAGLVHRDIKPGNLLLSEDGVVKITDFGIAYVAGSTPVTAAGAIMGTPGYIAPERLHGFRASPASDVYSLGMVAYECLVGAEPFAAMALEVAMAFRDCPMAPLPASVPPEAAALVGELMAKNPAVRPTADEVASRAGALRDQWRDPARPAVAAPAPAEAAATRPVATPPPAPRPLPAESMPVAPELAEPEPAGRAFAVTSMEQLPAAAEPKQGRRRPAWLGWPSLAGLAAAVVVLLGLALGTVAGPGLGPHPGPVPSGTSSPKIPTGANGSPRPASGTVVSPGGGPTVNVDRVHGQGKGQEKDPGKGEGQKHGHGNGNGGGPGSGAKGKANGKPGGGAGNASGNGPGNASGGGAGNGSDGSQGHGQDQGNGGG